MFLAAGCRSRGVRGATACPPTAASTTASATTCVRWGALLLQRGCAGLLGAAWMVCGACSVHLHTGAASRTTCTMHPLLPRPARTCLQAAVVTMESNWEPCLKGMLQYAAAPTCRRALLCRHFGEAPARCAGMCDRCRPTGADAAGTAAAAAAAAGAGAGAGAGGAAAAGAAGAAAAAAAAAGGGAPERKDVTEAAQGVLQTLQVGGCGSMRQSDTGEAAGLAAVPLSCCRSLCGRHVRVCRAGRGTRSAPPSSSWWTSGGAARCARLAAHARGGKRGAAHAMPWRQGQAAAAQPVAGRARGFMG